ncbi:MAG: sulfatase [Planctomycetota bacterium]|jgi:arylsulfatase A-like enzyme
MRILYLDIDTLRADHLGCYGYHRGTSPNIDRIAREGVRFDGCYCSDAPCQPSRAALMTGRFGIHTGLVGHGGTAAEVRTEGATRGFRDVLARDSLPAFLRSAGLKTVSISPFAERHGSWHFYAGFSEMHNTGRCGGESAEEVTPTALEWIERNAKKDDWFLHVNYWDPHTAQEIGMYTNKENPRRPRQPGEIKDMADLRRMIDGYDCGIAYADKHAGMLLEALGKQGVLDDVAIIVSSDHGENQGELGIYGEHATADFPTSRIPMIVKWPGAKGGHVDTGLHYNLDLAPTLAALFDKEPRGSWDGASYAPAILEGAECGRDYLVLSQCAHVCQRSVRFGAWMYVRTYHDGYHLFPKEMLFDLAEDPFEQHDAAAERPELCLRAVYHLSDWHDRMMATMPSDTDPLWTVMKEGGPAHARGHLRDYCKRLEATGRGHAIEELKRRHPREFE